MKPLLRIAWLAAFLIGFSVLVSLQFMWLPVGNDVLGFVRLWLPLSGGLIFVLGYMLPREPAVWAVPLLAYLVPAAWFRRADFVDPLAIILLIMVSAISAFVFRRFFST